MRKSYYYAYLPAALLLIAAVFFPFTGRAAGMPGLMNAPVASPVWSFSTHGAIWATPAIDKDFLYVASDDHCLYAVDIRSRQLRWQAATSGPVRSRPLISGDKVIIASDDGMLYAFDRQSGTQRWRFDLKSKKLQRRLPDPDTPFYDYLQSSPVEKDGIVYIGSMSGYLFAIRAEDGRAIWTLRTGDMIRGTPLLADGKLYAGGWDGHVYAADARTGRPVWDFNTGGIIQSTPALVNGKIIIGSRSATLFALEPATGKVLWSQPYENGSWVESSAVAAGGKVVVGSSDALKLFAFDPDNGRQIWSFRTGGWTWATPAVSGNTVYIGALSASPYYQPGIQLHAGFFAVDARTGLARWRFVPPVTQGFITGGMPAAPAVSGGMVYAPSVDGKVYVFKE